MSLGKLIVIDGADGSGKATQVRLVVERLQEEGISVRTLDFPQYTNNLFGKLIRECLDGSCGDFIALHPKIASTLYAADRFESSEHIRDWLHAGEVVILDRYVSSNMIHQGAKIEDLDERTKFLSWLDEMEHVVFRTPRPDMIIHLDVPFGIRRNLLLKDSTRTSLDLAEEHFEHQRASEECARDIIKSVNKWASIQCVGKDGLLSKEVIHEAVYLAVKEVLDGRQSSSFDYASGGRSGHL